MKSFRRLLAFVAIVSLSVWLVIRYMNGYRLVFAEWFDAHYDDTQGGVHCLMNHGGLVCDLPEVHYTFLHHGVRLFTQCQAWDDKNGCRYLRVGKTYQCSRDDLGRMNADLMSCGDATVNILREGDSDER